MIGNDGTLLPDWPNENGESYYVWSCWETSSPEIDNLIERIARTSPEDQKALRAAFLCGPGIPRRKVGTPLALHAPYPDDHPLRRDWE